MLLIDPTLGRIKPLCEIKLSDILRCSALIQAKNIYVATCNYATNGDNDLITIDPNQVSNKPPLRENYNAAIKTKQLSVIARSHARMVEKRFTAQAPRLQLSVEVLQPVREFLDTMFSALLHRTSSQDSAKEIVQSGLLKPRRLCEVQGIGDATDQMNGDGLLVSFSTPNTKRSLADTGSSNIFLLFHHSCVGQMLIFSAKWWTGEPTTFCIQQKLGFGFGANLPQPVSKPYGHHYLSM